MAPREVHWVLFWTMLGGVACFAVLALCQRSDFETACEMSRAAHMLASIVLTWVAPRILPG